MLTSLKHQGADSSLPFDNHLLDRLMDQAHIDVALTTGMGPRSGAGRFRVRSPDATSPRRC